MFASLFKLTDKLLKRTTSRCPVCHAPCPAEVWRRGGVPAQVWLKRTCPEHGEASVCIASDARFYWLAKGRSEGGCCGTGLACCASNGAAAGTLGRNAEPGEALGLMEKLSTCLALIEIVNSCNLACPTCFADSPVGTGARVDAVPLADLQRRIQGVLDRKGKIEILQLSGGEPTLHPQFFELLRWLHANPKIDYVLLNTNGVRIANDDAFAAELAATFRYGRFQLYLQFDGPQEAGQKWLRGADLRATRERCLERCREMKLPVTLAMTVTPENLPNLWSAVEFGLRWPNVRGICFQPVFTSGRGAPGKSKVQNPNSKAGNGNGHLNPEGAQPAIAPERRSLTGLTLPNVQSQSEAGAPAERSAGLQPALDGHATEPVVQPLLSPGKRTSVSRSETGAPAERSAGLQPAFDNRATEPVVQPLLSPGKPESESRSETGAPAGWPSDDKNLRRLNTADIILASVAQSGGKLRFEDFTPLPCGDPNCATIGYLLKVRGQIRSVSDFIDFKSVQGFLGTKIRYQLEDLMKCGCESEPLGQLLKQFELDESHTFRLFIKPFMDAATWDEDRIDRCCTHVIRPDGKLDSFCRYYSGFAESGEK